MKTIIYLFIAIFLFGSVIMSFTNKLNTKNSILIQATDNNVSSALLSQSAKIISDRLKDFSSEKFDITVVPEKNQIQVILTNTWDLKAVTNLLLQKGRLAIYETYNRKGLAELLNGDNHLFSLLKGNAQDSGAKIGCIAVAEVEHTTDYLNSLGLNQKCKFAWQLHSDNSDACLFALKADGEKGSLIAGPDIESVKSNQGKTSKNYEVEIKLKKSAIALWSNATKRNIGNSIAIVIDNEVISDPIVRSVIDGGNCEIAGDFTQNQTRYIAALGNNGELPVLFKVVK